MSDITSQKTNDRMKCKSNANIWKKCLPHENLKEVLIDASRNT
jgi:hypothetical protein